MAGWFHLFPSRMKLQNHSPLWTSVWPPWLMTCPRFTLSYFSAFQRATVTGLSCVFSTACRVPYVYDNKGVPQPVLLPIQCRPVEHWNQHLHTRRSLPCCATHTDDLFQSDQPDAGVLCCQELPGGGVTALPPGGVGLGCPCFLAKSARTPERRAQTPRCSSWEWGLTWGLGRWFEGGLGSSFTGLASHLRRLSPDPIVSHREQHAPRRLDFPVPTDRIFSLSLSFFNLGI